MKNILITGSSGYIGKLLIKNLLLKSNKIKIYALVRENVINNLDNVIYIKCDLSHLNFSEILPRNIDVVIHLAQSNNYRLFPEKADDIFNINISSTQKLLEWSRINKIKKFIYSSSGNVYKRKKNPLIESDICSPEDYYGKSKYIAELLIESYKAYYNICTLRIFGVYGPNQTGMTIPNIINKVKNSEKITLAKGKGLYFSPLFIFDCIEMISLIIDENQSKNYEVYNLSGFEIVTLNQIVLLASEKFGIEANIEITDKEPDYLVGSSTKFIKKFNFNFSKNFNLGLNETWN